MSFAAPPDRTPTALSDRLLLICGLACSAALLYAIAALPHVGGAAAIGALGLSAAAFAWSVALYRAPSRAVLGAGAVLGIAMLVLWIAADPAQTASGALGAWSQSIFLCRLLPAGLSVSVGRWTPAALGTLVSIANLDAIALVALAAATRHTATAGRGRGRHVIGVAGGALVLLSCVSLTAAAGGHVH